MKLSSTPSPQVWSSACSLSFGDLLGTGEARRGEREDGLASGDALGLGALGWGVNPSMTGDVAEVTRARCGTIGVWAEPMGRRVMSLNCFHTSLSKLVTMADTAWNATPPSPGSLTLALSAQRQRRL